MKGCGRFLIALCLACTSCSSPGLDTSPGPEFDLQLARTLDEARQGGASAAQLRILEESASAGVVTFEAASEAVYAAVDCMVDAGLNARSTEYTFSSGLKTPAYKVSVPAGSDETAALALLDDCDRREMWWVNQLYQMQPTSLQLVDDEIASKAPALRACLEREGVLAPLNDDATPQDLADRALEVAIDTSYRVDCVAEAGIDGF